MVARSPDRLARRAVAIGLMALLAWAVLAAWSGHLTPLGRRALLDGTGPPPPYNWVSPPPDLADANIPPSSLVKTDDLGPGGIVADTPFTSDFQVTLVVNEGLVPPAPDQTKVRITIKPVDPSGLPPPGGNLVAFGNAYVIAATYQPSGDPVTTVTQAMPVVIAYPRTATLTSTEHIVLYSPDGTSWVRLETHESEANHEANADLPGFGTVLVAGVPESVGSQKTRALVVAGVAALCLLLVGIGLVARMRAARRREDPDAASRRA